MSRKHAKINKGLTLKPQSAVPSDPEDGDIYYDNTLNKFRAYQNGSWGDLVAGASQGINYVINSDAEADASSHTLYDDGAVSVPIDGTGGSPSTLTLTRSTAAANLVRGDGSFLLSKSAADGQGEGVHIEVDPIDPADTFKRLQVSLDYKLPVPGSNNYASGDIRVFIYDVDNATLIGAVENDDDGDIIRHEESSVTFTGWFQATDSLNYRLLLHVTSTNASTWDIAYDNVKLGPNSFVQSTFQKTEVINLSGSGNFTAGQIVVARNGNIVTITNTIPTTHASLSSATSAGGIIPEWARPISINHNVVRRTAAVIIEASVDTAGAYAVTYRDFTGATVNTTGTFLTGTLTYSVESISNTISNTELTQQTIKTLSNGTTPTGTLAAAFNTVVFGSVDEDTHGSYNTSTGDYTVLRDGYYSAEAYLEIQTSTHSSGTTIVASVRVRNLTTSESVRGGDQEFQSSGGNIQTNLRPVCSGLLKCTKGDILRVESWTTAPTPSYVNVVTNSGFSISSLPDFTSYGVLNPKTEYIEAIDTANSSGTSSLNTWSTPNPAFTIQLTPGTWDLSLMGNIIMAPNVGGSVMSHVALATSSTAGSGILLDRTCATHGTQIGDAVAPINIDYKNYTITSTTNIYVHTKGTVFSVTGGTPTSLNNHGLRHDVGTGAVLCARRVK